MSEEALLGGSWVVKIRVISRITIGITHIRGLIAPIITTHEPPGRTRELFNLRKHHSQQSRAVDW